MPAYMKLGDIKGESTDQEHKDWIIIESMSAGISHSGSAAGGGRSSGKVNVQDIAVTKFVDKSSAILLSEACNGKVFPKVEIHLTASYGDREDQQTYLSYELSQSLISGFAQDLLDAGSGDVPVESLSFNYTKVTMKYTPYDAQGNQVGPPVVGSCGR